MGDAGADPASGGGFDARRRVLFAGRASLASTLSAARLGVGPTLGFTRHEQETKGGRLSRPPFSSVCRSA